jgi:hypothetical protein
MHVIRTRAGSRDFSYVASTFGLSTRIARIQFINP